MRPTHLQDKKQSGSADDVYGMSVATLSRAGTCQARRLNEGPWLNVRHKVEEAVTAGVRLWMELEESHSEEWPGAAAVRAKEVAQGTLAMSGACMRLLPLTLTLSLRVHFAACCLLCLLSCSLILTLTLALTLTLG